MSRNNDLIEMTAALALILQEVPVEDADALYGLGAVIIAQAEKLQQERDNEQQDNITDEINEAEENSELDAICDAEDTANASDGKGCGQKEG